MSEYLEYVGYYDGMIIRLRRDLHPASQQLRDWDWLWTRLLGPVTTAGATGPSQPS